MIKLITDDKDLLSLFVLLGVSVITSILLHWVIICGRLYRRGARFPTGLLFWRVFRELRQYRDLTCAAAKPLTFYYFGFIFAWFNLLLALAIALRIFWLQSHPVGY
jgi:hypothetical protein